MYEVISEGRRERKKREVRSRIFEVGQRLFAEHGFDGTTVEQIAAAADVAPATFFNYFATKNALLDQMMTQVFDYLQALVDEQLARPVSAQERIIGFAERAAKELTRTHELAHDVLAELMLTSARSGEVIPYVSRVHEPFTTIIREGQERGEVRDDLDPGFLAEVVVGAINAPVTHWINHPLYPVERRLRQAAVFAAEAIEPRATTAARKEIRNDDD